MQTLAQQFLAAADEVGRLQRGKDAECQLFQVAAEQGHYGGRTEPTDTRQGIYALAPSGAFLASCNSNDPARVAAMLREALAKLEALPEEQRRLAPEQLQRIQATERFEDRLPQDGLVLAMVVRDLDRPVDVGNWRTRAWNEDQAWFTKAEALAMVPEPRVGAVRDLEARLVDRLVRLHLVDTVRGQSSPFRKEHVRAASLRAEVVAVDGDVLQLALTGASHAEQAGRWRISGLGLPVEAARGVRTELEGRATFDRAQQRFTRFELLAVGTRWGGTQYNERGKDQDESRIGFGFVIVGDEHARVAPAFWWEYDLR